MEAVEFLDSTGLGVLVGGLKKVRAHDGSLQLICTQDRLLKIFRITGLAKVFVIHDSADGRSRALTLPRTAPGQVANAVSTALRTPRSAPASATRRLPGCGVTRRHTPQENHDRDPSRCR